MVEPRWTELSRAAWAARENARILGRTKVGAAALSSNGAVFAGCNIEHRFRCHDLHAEVGAVTAMIVAGHREMRAILIAADRERFTPCGGCLDWIFEVGGPQCLVAFQPHPDAHPLVLRAEELMPHYPH